MLANALGHAEEVRTVVCPRLERVERSVATTFLVIVYIFIVLLSSGCQTSRHSLVGDLTPEEQIVLSFQDTAPEVVASFCTNNSEILGTLREDMREGLETMPENLNKLVEELDSYTQRMGFSDSDDLKIQQWLDVEFERFLFPALDRFYSDYKANVGDLEAQLLVNTALEQWMSVHRRSNREKAASVKFPASPKALKGSPWVKNAEELATFIPVAGDIYDLFRSFVYDARMEKTKQHAQGYVPLLQTRLDEAVLSEVQLQLPGPEETLEECRKRFNPSEALKMLNHTQ